MTGYESHWASWKPHPKLANDWREFSDLSIQGPHYSDLSKLLMGLIHNGQEVSNDFIETDHDSDKRGAEHQSHSFQHSAQEEVFSQSPLSLTQFKSPVPLLLSQPTEQHDIDSILLELHEALESQKLPLSEDLVSSLSDLPQQALPQLLQRLQDDLTEEGLQSLCELACEDIQDSLHQNNWLHPALISKFILLPNVLCKGECMNEIRHVVEEFARYCPKIVIVQILEPLLNDEKSVSVQHDLLERAVSALPIEHHLHLIKFVLESCEVPLQVTKVPVLLAAIRTTAADVTPILKKLMYVLEKSGALLADDEEFSNLLLIIIQRLPSNTPRQLQDVLANIVRQNKSFNKQILLNALKDRAS